MGAELASGSLLVAAVVALAAGFVSFASPCVLPLVPGFLGYVTGLSDVSLEQRPRGRLVLGAVLFVLGFTADFLVAAAAVSAVGLAFREYQSVLLRVGGAFVLPTTLSSVNATFRGNDRIVAFAVWGAVISGMAAACRTHERSPSAWL